MSICTEIRQYHLTPRGWIEGSYTNNTLGGSREVSPPEDRVLTISCHYERASLFEKARFFDRVETESTDESLVTELQGRFGARPDWFGYAKMSAKK